MASPLDDGDLIQHVGEPADVAASAYLYRSDKPADQNPPESWILLMQYASLPFDKRVDTHAPAVEKVLCGLLWEEVRPIRRVELSWPADARRPSSDEIALSYFDATDDAAHTWWNPRTIQDAGKPEVSADGHTYVYTIPVDTWGVVAALRGEKRAASVAVPSVRAFVPDRWKELDLEIEWGFDARTASLAYDGELDAYDAVLGDVQPLANDSGTTITAAHAWRSSKSEGERRGVRCSLLYIGTSRWRRVWPYLAQPEDVARSIVTLKTVNGSFSFQVSDVEQGPILAPEYGFFVRATGAPRVAKAASPSERITPAPMQLLSDKVDAIPGVPLMRGWATNTLPWMGANSSNEAGASGSLIVPARSVAMHPTPDRDVVVVWHSPIDGALQIEGSLAMADSLGGNGVDWTLIHDDKNGRSVLDGGALATGARQSFTLPANASKSSAITVKAGDSLVLVVDAKSGNHFCDTTIVELAIAEVGGSSRRWSLTHDVVDSIHTGNPHADSYGTPDVWRFGSTAALPPPPALSEPPFALSSTASSARSFVKELATKKLKTVRERVREHPEQSWVGAVEAMHGVQPEPPIPAPAFEPAMQVEVPSEQLTAQWKLGAWHILRRSLEDSNGKWSFNDYPFGILASETGMILRALDLQGMHKEAADGLDQWLRLPVSPRIVPGENGYHALALPDRPLGHFSDGEGSFTHAEGPPGVGGNMDGIHAMGPGAIVFALSEHFRLTGDLEWLKKNAARIRANAEWILRQRHLLASIIPGGDRLWSAGLQPAHVVTPDSMSMHMQFYESEAYYWLAVKRTAELLAFVDEAASSKMNVEAEAYRRELLAAIDRSIALTPVVPVRDGSYHSFIPFAPYVRGFAAGAWGWRRCQGHVGAIYWDTVQSADPLVSPSGLLSPLDPRVQGHLDVLEDRLLLENTKVNTRTANYDPERDWFAHASWQYQCGLERQANIHLEADDAPNFIRSMLNQYAVDILPGEYTFREHTTGGPPDKSFEEACFLERYRQMLVMEVGDTLWLARATPREWLGDGKRIAVRNAPSAFGPVAYAIVSQLHEGKIIVTLEFPSRRPAKVVLLRLRHPSVAPIRSVDVNGKPWSDFDRDKETIRLTGLSGSVVVRASY